MFPWDFARSAEAMFSRWAIKRVCKFLLKKRLGDLILGDIDLDQLDVQLSRGTIQLADLALNVDFLNQKLVGAPVMVKEGSIASLSVKIPWKLQNCQIEVEELELVLAPFVEGNSSRDADSCIPNHDGKERICVDSDKIDLEAVPSSSRSISLNVHEGVKTIARMVKWFLTSFHVRLKNLIIAFDPCSAINEKTSAFHRSLVLRIAETEYGTCVSEDDTTVPNPKSDGLLGMAKLTNFVKFKGAVIEFLQMDDVDDRPQLHCDLGTSFSEWYAGSSQLGNTTTILTGASGGFSGKLNLSIPWKNGSLDIRKVDADVSVEPVKLTIQPSTIEWIIIVWDSLKNVGKAGKGHVHYKPAADSFSPNSKFYGQPSTPGSSVIGSETVIPRRGNFSKSIYKPVDQQTFPDSLPPRTQLIHNWVPLYINEEDRTEVEPDYGESIDQFFECFDGIRSSQASSGNSGIWNWTCSVFSAITVASNLASGSGQFPIEQQHAETSLRATIAQVSVVLSFYDEEQKQSHDLMANNNHIKDQRTIHGSLSPGSVVNLLLDDQSSDSYMSCLSSMNIEQSILKEVNSISLDIQKLEARCQNVVLNLQMSSQKMKFEASVMHVKVDEYYDNRNRAEEFGFIRYKDNSYDQMILNEHLQRQVLGGLPPFPFSVREPDSETSVKENASRVIGSTISHDGLVRVGLLESFGVCRCHYAASSTDLDGRSMTSTSFSVHLPPLVLWVDFHLVNMLLNLCKQVENYLEKIDLTKDFASDVPGKRYNSSSVDDVKSGTSTYITTLSPRANLQGNIVLHQSRVIICFPSEFHRDSRHSTSLDKFIILEHSPSFGMRKVLDAFLVSKAASTKGSSCTPSTSIHLNIGNFDIYLVDSAKKDCTDGKFCTFDRQSFSTVKILAVTSRTNDHSGITMVWQKGPVTGPWMASRAWSLATSHDQSKHKVTREGHGFCSVTTAENLEQTSSHIRQELILSSAFFLHVCFSLVQFNLGSNDYKVLNHLLNQVMDVLSKGAHDSKPASDDSIKNVQFSLGDTNTSQTSVLVDCDVLDLCIIPDDGVEISCSMQKELPGSWNCLRLKIEKFELLSVSNIGGISNAKFFWLNHGEGELWGSIFDRNEKASAVTQDFLLISCKDSTIRRGSGEGANALSFGSAGTAITHLWNPQLLQSYTSIVVRCGTIIAPGGRLDWIGAICLFFSLPHENEQSGDDGMESKSSLDNAAHKTSFFLDLVDIALSYEPYMKYPTDNCQDPDTKDNGVVRSHEEIGKQCVACLLAAASLSLSNHTMAHSTTISYSIKLQDLGLLICESSGSKNDSGGYHVGYLQKTGYAKVAQEALVEAVLRIKGLLWEIECSDCHINLDTCHDTTYGLVRLVDQLQQIYAPDMEDAVAHLQSRWNSFQQAHNEDITNNAADTSSRSSIGSSTEKSPTSEEDCQSVGLLDEILENAFDMNGEFKPDAQFHSQEERGMPEQGYNLNISTSTSNDAFAQRIPLEGSMYSSRIGRIQKSSVRETCSPEIIESYYVSELLPPSKLTAGYQSPQDDHKCKFNVTDQRDTEYGKGGWYNDGSFMIVENHISKIVDQPGGKQLHQECKLGSANSDSTDNCRHKGRILLKNIDVRWRMYAGLDWSKDTKPTKNSTCSSNSTGRDGNVCLDLTLSELNLQYDLYPDGEINVSKLSVSVRDIHLYDRSSDAPWKMVLGYYSSKDHRRESCAKAFKLDLETVRPDPLTPLEDYRLYLEFLPMRLHLDQDQLNFLISFFGNDSFAEDSPSLPNNFGSEMSGRKNTFGTQTIVEEALLPFFQKCDVRPVVLRVDYIPRHIDLAALRRGNYAELLNLVPWKGIDLQLKHVCAVGVYGWSSVCETVVGEWLEDISHNQVHKLLKGLAPIRSLFAVSSGTSKLVSLPVKSYRKDHKLLKGIQRGALAFIKSISLEAVGLGMHLAAGAHEILLQTEYVLTSIPPSMPSSEKNRTRTVARSIQPEDARQGIQQAYESLSDGFSRTASALLGSPIKAYQRGAGAGSALATAIRAVPTAAIAPVSASARAVHCALLGVRNSLDPEHQKESMEKYLGPSRS